MTDKIIKRPDMACVAVVILLAILTAIPVFASGEAARSVVIQYDGGELVLSLNNTKTFDLTSNGYTLHITVADGKISVANANCPDRFCVACGAISQQGETIICVPAHVLIEVSGNGADRDAIAG